MLPIRVRILPFLCTAALAGALLCPAAQAAKQASFFSDTPSAEQQRIEHLIEAKAYKDALAALDKDIALEPKNLNFRFTRTVVLDKMGRKADAAKGLEEIIAKYPEVPDPYNNLAVLRAAEGRIEDAKKLLDKALLINPDFALARKNLGDLYLHQALEAYRAAAPELPYNTTLQKRLKTLEQLVAPKTTGADKKPKNN